MAAMQALNGELTRAAWVLRLSDVLATDIALTGAKASNLARARRYGFPVVPGFVLTTASPGPEGLDDAAWLVDLNRRFRELTHGGGRVVVRSSSIAEDGADSSMAGMFRSITNVAGWDEFLEAIRDVYASAVTPLRPEPAPMAVLIQKQLDAGVGGVMFGVDPISGRRDRIVVAVVPGSPEALVSGDVDGSRYTLTKRGRTVHYIPGAESVQMSRLQRRRLSTMARQAESAFGGPQDIEWAEDVSGDLWMLQSRPVTAVAATLDPIGPVLGPGPVAETFPDSLFPLEDDLWLEPFREGLKGALQIAGMRSRKRLESSPVVVSVGGRAAVDLDLIGALPGKRSFLRKLDPRQPARRLAASWRVGRLRAALPGLASDVIEAVYDDLATVGSLSEHGDDDLVALLARSRRLLVTLHGHEALAGMLLHPNAEAESGASIALRSLANARAEGLADPQIPAAYPETLGLYPPAIGRVPQLPRSIAIVPEQKVDADPLAAARESLRLAARLVQEMSARAAAELGRRGVRTNTMREASDVKWLRFDELEAAVAGGLVALDLGSRKGTEEPPLPVAFRLTESGEVVPQTTEDEPSPGQGAGGGRAVGAVRTRMDDVGPGDVLVVRSLDPQLAGLLPILGGLVSETGSVLSHLAILAREFAVPTVVGVSGATDRFAPGSTVVVDGTRGIVDLLESDEVAP